MEFYLGTHHPNWLERTSVPLFISRRRLTDRKTLPVPEGRWALDSGGFTELSLYGHWQTSESDYVADVERFQGEMPGLQWVAPMDWMCEPQIIAKTGGSVPVHQQLTVENFLRLRDKLGPLVIPVLQGWTLDDYQNCWGLYEHHGIDLETEPLVGLGTVCRRQDTSEAERIVRSLTPLRLHGFGVKATGLEWFGDALASSDSMAWSFRANMDMRQHVRSTPLFDWPRIMLCGREHPAEHKAKSCANCMEWAMQWRQSVLEKLEIPA